MSCTSCCIAAARSRFETGSAALLLSWTVVLMCVCGPLAHAAETTQLISISSGGTAANDASGRPSVSADGRYVAFWSYASDLVPNDTNGVADIFVRDRLTGTTEIVSVASGGALANGECRNPSISADGRYVAFQSVATNLVPGDTNGVSDVFVRDRSAGTTVRVSVGAGGAQGDGASQNGRISANGRFVAFDSYATTLVVPATSTIGQVFVRDTSLGTTECVSVGFDGNYGDDDCANPSISQDGRCIAFESVAANIVPDDTNGVKDIFVRDRLLGATVRASTAADGTQADGYSRNGVVSADGRYVVYDSDATNLEPGLTMTTKNVYLYDRMVGTTERVSVAIGGGAGDGASSNPSISADGRFVAFATSATNLVQLDTNEVADVIVRDRLLKTTERVSVCADGTESASDSSYPAVCADGRLIAFYSLASLVAEDTNGGSDIYARCRPVPVLSSAQPASGRIGQTVMLTATLVRGIDGAPAAGEKLVFIDGMGAQGAAITDASGVARYAYIIPEDPGPGTRTFTAVHDPSDTCGPSVAGSTLTVAKGNPSFSMYAVTGSPGETVALSTLFLARANPSMPIIGRTIQFAVDGVNVGSAVSDASGASCSYTIPASMATGVHNVTVSFAGTGYYNPAARTSAALTVLRNVSLSLYAASGQRSQQVTLRSLIYSGGAPLPGKSVKWYVDGAYVGTSVSGAADVSLPYTIPASMSLGTHNVTVAFAGDAAYRAVSRTSAVLTVKITPANVGFSMYAVSGSPGQTVTLRSLMYSGGKPLAGKLVTWFVDGVRVGTSGSGVTDVSIAYPIPASMAAGKHAVTISFAGDAAYNPASRTTEALTVR